MLTNEEVIEALHKGREQRPVKIAGNLFRNGDKACALGAIAIGLGFEPELWDNGHYDEGKGYSFLTPTIPHLDDIWRQNDNCFEDRVMITDPDVEVIRVLNGGKVLRFAE